MATADDLEEQQLKDRLKKQMTALGSSRLAGTRPPMLTRRLEVTVLGAKNLPNVIAAGKVDSFIRVVCAEISHSTRVEWDTMDPVFDETFVIPYNSDTMRVIVFEAWHHDTYGPRALGKVEFDTRQLTLDVPSDVWKPVDNCTSKGDIGFRCLLTNLLDESEDTAEEVVQSPAHFGHTLQSPPQSPSYKAMDLQPSDIPDDPWSVMEPNSDFFDEKEEDSRAEKMKEVYYDWDLDASGRIEFEEINSVLVSFKKCDQEETHLRVLKRWATLVTAKQIPDGGYDRDMLIPFVIRLTNVYSSKEFEEFLKHVWETSQLLLEITEVGRQRKAFWRLFKAWDTDRNLTLDTNQLQHIILATEYGKANEARVMELLQGIRDKAPEKKGIDDVPIKTFHLFMEDLIGEVTEMEMHFVVGQIRTAMREEVLDDPHIVCRHLAANKVMYGGDRPNGNPVDDDLSAKLMYQIRSDARHAFDALTLEDIEECLNDRNPTDTHRIIATPICLMFGLKPREEVKTRKLCYWEGLKQFIVDDPRRFLHFLQNFEAKYLPYDLMQKIIVFHFKEESDPHRLMLVSRFLSCLCVWCEATVRLSCMINDWEYPPPPRHDSELIEPTYQAHDDPRMTDRTPGYMREYPANVRLGIDTPPRSMPYKLPQWALVQHWEPQDEVSDLVRDVKTGHPARLASGYKGPPPRQNNSDRPSSCVTDSGASGRLTTLLDLRAIENLKA